MRAGLAAAGAASCALSPRALESPQACAGNIRRHLLHFSPGTWSLHTGFVGLRAVYGLTHVRLGLLVHARTQEPHTARTS